MNNLNNLKPLELELLTMLVEEASEVIQASTKCIRHGLHNHHPDQPENCNIDELREEITQFFGIFFFIAHELKILDPITDVEAVKSFKEKLQYTYHVEVAGEYNE